MPSTAMLPPLAGGAWLGGAAVPDDSLRGRVVVVAFWSDTDPRALDALPRVQSWHDAYARYGVRVVAVHAPEFAFGADSLVALRVARRLGLTLPIALDPSHGLRARMGVDARGGIVVADAGGRIVRTTDLEQLDRVDHAIRAALRRTHPDVGFPEAEEPPPLSPRAIDVVPLGAGRVAAGPLADVIPGRPNLYTTQFRYQEEGKDLVPYPVGRWVATAEGLVAEGFGPSQFVAVRDPGARMFAVISPPPGGGARLWILADSGWLPAAERGADVREDGHGGTYVDVAEPRLYEIARFGTRRVLRFSPERPGLVLHQWVFERTPKDGAPS